MEANAVIWIWNYISFMLHYHFMVVMTVRRWNIYRLFRRHLSNTFPEGHLGLKIHYPFVKLCLESQFRNQPIRTFFSPSTLNVFWRLPPLPPHWWASHPANEGDYSGGKWDRDLSCHSLWNGHISRVITASVGPGHDSVLVLVKVILLHFKLFSRWSPRLWSCLSYWWMLLLRL